MAPSLPTESSPTSCAALTCYTDLLVSLLDLPAWTFKFRLDYSGGNSELRVVDFS